MTVSRWLSCCALLLFVGPLLAQQQDVNYDTLCDTASSQSQHSVKPANGSLLSAVSYRVNNIELLKKTSGDDADLDEKLDQDLASTLSTYQNKTISSEQLRELRYKLSAIFVDHNYINSGVIIPDQKVTNGTIYLCAIAGKIDEIDIRGTHQVEDQEIRQKIIAGSGTPLNMDRLHQTLVAMQADPMIATINANLQPGSALGKSLLFVNIKENSPYALSLSVNNQYSPSVGGTQVLVDAQHGNLLGRRDIAQLRAGATMGLYDFFTSYQFPLRDKKSLLMASVNLSKSDVIEEPFNQLEIENHSQSYSLVYRRLLGHYGLGLLNGAIGFDSKHSLTTLFGTPYSFSDGVQDGESQVSVLHLSADWKKSDKRSATNLSATTRWGMNVLNATINDNAPDGRFVSVQGFAQYAWKTNFKDMQYLLRTHLQYAFERLLPIEKMPLGGFATVRGQRENRYIGDNGVAATAEVRAPLLHRGGRYLLQLIGFVDTGMVADVDESLLDTSKKLLSLGGGLAFRPDKKWYMDLFYGYAINKKSVGNSIQDMGIHFNLSYKLY